MINKYSFKIGDKVKLKPDYTKRFQQGVKAGRVKGFENFSDDGYCDTGYYILVDYKGCGSSPFPYLPKEIEHAVKVGDQLMFNFMEGN